MKNKLILRRMVMLLTILSALTVNILFVSAAENTPDVTRKGSVSITLRDKVNNKAVSGGEITLYQVAALTDSNHAWNYQYVNGFENCTIKLGNLQDSALAGKLESKLSASVKGTAKTVDDAGKVSYTNLDTGLYLLVQTKASEGYEKISSFLVSVPLKTDGKWVYDVDASPKVETISQITPTVTKVPDTPGNSGGRLPQTGQLDWPIPLLCICGMLVFAAGWVLKKGDNE